MNRQHQYSLLRPAIAIVLVNAIALAFLSSSLKAQSILTTSDIAQGSTISFTPPPPPPDRDAPGTRGGGAGRGCGAGSQSVTALMPEYQQALAQGGMITKVWGLTTTGHPTFWFDVPYEKTAIASLEFVLQDNSSPAKAIYRSAIVPPTTPGIISIALPTTTPSLEPERLYKWFLKVRLQCSSSGSATQPRLQKEELYGWVQRQLPDTTLTRQLQQATPRQQATLYAQNGIWFDALSTLADLRLAHPQDTQLAENWKQLLQTVGLEKLTTKPLTAPKSSNSEGP